MKKWLLTPAATLIFVLLIGFLNAGAEEPIRAGQPHEDVFEVAGIANLQLYNPVTVQAKISRSARYRLIIMPGCTAGSIASDLQALSDEMERTVQFRLVRDDANPQFTIRLNCGLDHVRICSSVNIFCLGRGFPSTPDVDISDIMYTPIRWPDASRLGILSHEVGGHAIATWMEQYCLGRSTYPSWHPCYQLPRFTPTPNWHDFMNTGSNSRHGFEAIEAERWERTMYALQETCDGSYGPPDHSWGGCWHGDVERWFGRDGWSQDPDDGWIYNPQGQLIWAGCDLSWRGCYHWPSGLWVGRDCYCGFHPATGWAGVPLP